MVVQKKSCCMNHILVLIFVILCITIEDTRGELESYKNVVACKVSEILHRLLYLINVARSFMSSASVHCMCSDIFSLVTFCIYINWYHDSVM
jgi:hypothetical protein